MKDLLHLAVAASLAIGGFAFMGCEETQQPKGENGVTAGGNGEFGENPARSGEYKSNVAPPTTQPSYNQTGSYR